MAPVRNAVSLQLMLFDRLRLCPALLGLGRGLPLSNAHLPVNASGTKPLDLVVLFGVIATPLAVAVLACLGSAWCSSRR
jgi:hypothetical protein